MVVSSVDQVGLVPNASWGYRPSLGLGAAVGLFLLQPHFPGPLPTALMLLAIAVPLGAFGIYLSTLNRIHAFSVLSEDFLIRRYLPGTAMRLVIGWIGGLFGATIVAVQMLSFGPIDWIILASVVPIVL